jgi:hypothetical protein
MNNGCIDVFFFWMSAANPGSREERIVSPAHIVVAPCFFFDARGREEEGKGTGRGGEGKGRGGEERGWKMV